MAFTLPPLPYPSDALEPHIDKQTMEIHHDKHHGAYVNNLNKALESAPDLRISRSRNCSRTILRAFPRRSRRPSATTAAVTPTTRLFWNLLSAKGGGAPKGDIESVISSNFGGFDGFKEKFNAAATSRFGSGWAWLVKDGGGKFEIISTANQDSPLMEGKKPILGLDVWEHAYYLKYQNRRPEYIAAWWNVVNWDEVNKQLK